jgi:prolyl-tRNA editing enzyme YbaK/EbsC (Cys-tRNA(Pro) deacylase)
MKHLLDCFGISYQTIPLTEVDIVNHVPKLDLAAATQLVDPVLLLSDGQPILVLLSAGAEVDPTAVGRERDAVATRQAAPHEFAQLFPRVDLGGMPSLGNLCGVDVMADESLARSSYVAFFNGTHAELLCLGWADLVRLIDPIIGQFARRRAASRRTHVSLTA